MHFGGTNAKWVFIARSDPSPIISPQYGSSHGVLQCKGWRGGSSHWGSGERLYLRHRDGYNIFVLFVPHVFQRGVRHWSRYCRHMLQHIFYIVNVIIIMWKCLSSFNDQFCRYFHLFETWTCLLINVNNFCFLLHIWEISTLHVLVEDMAHFNVFYYNLRGLSYDAIAYKEQAHCPIKSGSMLPTTEGQLSFQSDCAMPRKRIKFFEYSLLSQCNVFIPQWCSLSGD